MKHKTLTKKINKITRLMLRVSAEVELKAKAEAEAKTAAQGSR